MAQPQVIEVSFQRSSHDPVTGIISSKLGISIWFHKGPTGCRVLFRASSSTPSYLINWSVLIQLIDQTVGASLVERKTCSHSVLSEVTSSSKVEVKAARSRQTKLGLVSLEKCFLDWNKIDNFFLLSYFNVFLQCEIKRKDITFFVFSQNSYIFVWILHTNQMYK